jgi:hypothetical protein
LPADPLIGKLPRGGDLFVRRHGQHVSSPFLTRAQVIDHRHTKGKPFDPPEPHLHY